MSIQNSSIWSLRIRDFRALCPAAVSEQCAALKGAQLHSLRLSDHFIPFSALQTAAVQTVLVTGFSFDAPRLEKKGQSRGNKAVCVTTSPFRCMFSHLKQQVYFKTPLRHFKPSSLSYSHPPCADLCNSFSVFSFTSLL